MNTIVLAVLAVTAIGVICAVMLATASKVMAVEVDDRVARIRESLPGANCGACGFAGCDGYAAALADGEDVRANLCIPGGDDAAKAISEILGVAFEDVVERVAVVHCGGSTGVAARKAAYQGVRSCAAAKLVYGGENACPFGCIGLGDCANVCPNGAICIEDGIARINTRLCTGCGMCAKVCPNHIIYTEADTITTVITCCSTEKGAVTRKKCAHGCIGCKRCERECPAQAITVTDSLAKIDYEKCTGCGHCAEICTTKCIEQASFSGIFR